MSTDNHNHGTSIYLIVPVVIFFGLLMFSVVRAPALVSGAGIGSAVIVVAPLILATYALTIIVMAGRAGVDLSIGPLIGFINVGMVQLHGAGFMDSAIGFFLYAMGVGIAYQLVMGLIIVFVRVQPIIVSLSGYLTLVGLNLIIMPRPGGTAPEWMQSWGAGTTMFSPILVILAVATAAWYLLAQTAFFTNLRMMGSDERAAYTSGVHINLVRLGAHAIGGIYAGLAALTYTSLISSGDPTQGTTYTLMAVTALVLGGANLAGGRGSAFGSLLGALNIYLITYVLSTFNFGLVQSFVTDLAYGVMLVLSLLIGVAVPQLRKAFKDTSPVLVFMLLGVVALGVVVHTTLDQQQATAGAIESAMSSFKSSTIASSMNAADAAAADSGYPPGTYFLFIVLGVAAVAYLFRMLFRFGNASMAALTALIAVVALGLIFHSPPELDSDADPAPVYTAADSYQPMIMTFEPLADAASGSQLSDVVGSSGLVVVSILGVVLLSTGIILLMLPHVSSRLKQRSLSVLLIVAGFVAIGSLFFDGQDSAYLQSNFSGETYAILLVGVLLFTLTAPLVHTRFRDISRFFIVAIGGLAIICVYFFTAQVVTDPATAVQYAEPFLSYISPSAQVPVESISYAAPLRTDAVAQPSILKQLSFSAIAIVLLHIFLRIAMEEVSFRKFWVYWYTVIFSLLVWCALLYAAGVELWLLGIVVVLAGLTAPNVMHIIGTYIDKQHRDSAISQWEG